MDESWESYILLLLADGNLPTGSFVASSGLESYVTHGFFGYSDDSSPEKSSSRAASANQAVVDFIQDSLSSYARSALPFVSDAHITVTEIYSRSELVHADPEASLPYTEEGFQRLVALDNLFEAMTPNEVTRRASKAQGVALLTLFSKGFSKPSLPSSSGALSNDTRSHDPDSLKQHFADTMKLAVRRGDTPGHLAICWGLLTGSLGLRLERSQHLHLFLQARSLLSASVRLNTLGPYAAQQILLHVIRRLVDSQMVLCRNIRTNLRDRSEGDDAEDSDIDKAAGPANTWPLGEILAARHDLQHSRVFNS